MIEFSFLLFECYKYIFAIVNNVGNILIVFNNLNIQWYIFAALYIYDFIN